MNQPRHCPAVLIAAPASGQGKTTVTAALARLHRNLGRKVRVFKCGPDFLDPMIHERASGAPVYPELDASTPETFIRSVAPRYATDPRYAEKVLAIIEEWGLAAWDQK